MNNTLAFCQPVLGRPDLPSEWIVANDGDTITSTIAKGILTITDGAQKTFYVPWFLIDRLDGVKVLCPQDPVAQVDTLTMLVLPNADCCGELRTYNVSVTYQDENGETQTQKWHIDKTTGSTYTETAIVDAWVIIINNDPFAIVTASNSGGHLRLTDKVAGRGFRTNYNTVDFSISHTTANKISFGDGDDLIDTYKFTADDGIDADNDYVIIEIPYFVTADSSQPDVTINIDSLQILRKKKLWIIVESGGTAEDAILGTTIGTTTGLCGILAGTFTVSKYLGVINEGCPCS